MHCALVSVQLEQLGMNVEFLRTGGDPVLSICTGLAKNQAAGCSFLCEEEAGAALRRLKSVTEVWALWLAFPRSGQGEVLPLSSPWTASGSVGPARCAPLDSKWGAAPAFPPCIGHFKAKGISRSKSKVHICRIMFSWQLKAKTKKPH